MKHLMNRKSTGAAPIDKIVAQPSKNCVRPKTTEKHVIADTTIYEIISVESGQPVISA
ncbi:hypothetical protein D3C87_951610 [compost metagenome]